MAFLDDFGDIVKCQEPLACYTSFKLGGPAQMLAQPRSADELARLLRRCHEEQLPVRLLGGGSNVLVRDDGVRGVVVRLSEPAFTAVRVEGRQLRAAAGAPLAAVISEAAQHGLAGLEALVGIPGTVGGGLRSRVGARSGDITQSIHQVEVLDPAGTPHAHGREDWQHGTADDRIITAVTFTLEKDDPDALLKRLRKFWIHRKGHQPLSFQPAGRIFKDPRGLTADQLIEQAGLKGTRVGGAEVCERHANYVIAHPGATARDVHRLIDLIRSRVADRFGQHLEQALVEW
jgi:UDP-N-acetylmuramate dehydrogenase